MRHCRNHAFRSSIRQVIQRASECSRTDIRINKYTGSLPVLLVPGVHFWLDALAMVLFGIGIGVLICFLGGLMAVDIAPRNASGAALGVVGIASYIGAGLQDVMSGVLIEGQKTVVNGTDVYDFTYINWFWIGAALLSTLLALLVWNAKADAATTN